MQFECLKLECVSFLMFFLQRIKTKAKMFCKNIANQSDPVGKVVILNSAPILDGSPWSGQRPRGPQRPQSAPQRPPWAEYEIPREPSTTEAAWLGIRQLCASMKRESK